MAAPANVMVGAKVPLFGISDQDRDTEALGKCQWYTLTDVTNVVSATAIINMQNASLTHEADRKAVRNQGGNTSLLIYHDQRVRLDVTAIPEGATITSGKPVDAILSAKMPAAGGFVKLSDFPVILAFGESDIFNSENWIYEGGASIEAIADDRWGIRFSLMRYIAGGITKQVARV